MTLALQNVRVTLPGRVSAAQALELHRRGLLDGQPFLLMAKDWRVDPVDGDYEELTNDELDDEAFVEDFAGATLELWLG